MISLSSVWKSIPTLPLITAASGFSSIVAANFGSSVAPNYGLTEARYRTSSEWFFISGFFLTNERQG
jgi:hypothetical protein